MQMLATNFLRMKRQLAKTLRFASAHKTRDNVINIHSIPYLSGGFQRFARYYEKGRIGSALIRPHHLRS